jgi:hypothetical protein
MPIRHGEQCYGHGTRVSVKATMPHTYLHNVQRHEGVCPTCGRTISLVTIRKDPDGSNPTGVLVRHSSRPKTNV